MHFSSGNSILISGTLFAPIFCNENALWCKFSIIILKNDSGTASPNGAIWDEFIEQYKHQISTIFNAQFTLFSANKKQI